AACPNTSILYATSATALQPVYATVNLYASWNLVLSLTYNANSGTGSVPATVTNLSVGATPTVSVQGSLTRTGYIFAGWNTAANGTGTAYAASGSVTLAPMSANVTLYAQWQALLTLSYNSPIGLNSGTVPASVTGIVPGATPSVSGNTGNMVATGYVFGGWCTVTLSAGTACSGTTYQGGDTLAAMTVTKTLYAIWVTTYSVTYVSTYTPTTGTVPITLTGQLAGATPTVSGNTGNITRTSYVFTGWCTANIALGAACSGTSYQGGEMLPSMAANVTLYATWAPTYTVTYYNGYTAPSGTLPATVTGLVAGSTPTVSGNTGNLTYTGLSFAGWCTSNLSATTACSGTVYQGGSTLPPMAGNVTLYAIWGYSVTYNANYPASTTGQGSVPATVAAMAGTTVPVSSNTGLLTATTRQFLGWATTAGAASATYPAANPGSLPSINANVTLYAVWGVATTYTLTYNANFPASTTDTGTAPAQLTGLIAATTWTVSSNSGSLSVVGYTFGGWNAAANGTGTAYSASGTATLTMPAANVNLYAKWIINTFILTTTQVGSGGVSSSPAGITLAAPGSTTGTYNYNTSVVLTETPATGWSFTGWSGACTGTA
ncbi:MAG: InlB B-repeat-containing protein, partial [Patescibacteria group bacterium]|nr:InlB B-repeat-containing protein [Patescibacteria group bacterium]